jgi:enoyl-CoA hydratase
VEAVKYACDHGSALRARVYAWAISLLEVTPSEYRRIISSPFVDEAVAGDGRVSLIAIRADGDGSLEIPAPGSLPVPVVWIGEAFGGDGPANVDMVLAESDLAETFETISHAPLAAATLVVLLRAVPGCQVAHALAMESAAYSLLQAGPEFAAWRATADFQPDGTPGNAVTGERSGDTLLIELNRPHRHNAISAALRDELYAWLALAVSDDSIAHVHLRGQGPSFCSGGDLGEFGSRPDVANSHVTRLARSPARLIDQLGDRISVSIHGATLGGGIEMAAFASKVVAHPATSIGLPEIALGLIPGAGGTVSLTRRIGRQRTAALALTGRRIDAQTALTWRLVDDISSDIA